MNISIIVPYTTGRQMLRDCFDSLREQSFHDFEVIFIQDQLPDTLNQPGNIATIEQVKDLVQEFRESFPITYIENKHNLGVGACRNLGMQAAKGEYVYFLDMDDFLMENALELLVQGANEIETQEPSSRVEEIEAIKSAAATNEEYMQLSQMKQSDQMKTDHLSVVDQQLPISYDLVYGERRTSWYRRKVYLQTIEENAQTEDKDMFRQEDSQKVYLEGDDSADAVDISALELSRKTFVEKMIEKRKGLSNISVLHMLIRRQMVIENAIYFDEAITVNSDLVYMAKLLGYCKTMRYVPDALYIKRRRNNPVQYPSLTQLKQDDRFERYIESYQKAISYLGEDQITRNIIDQKLINYCVNHFVTKLRRSENSAWREGRFIIMHDLVRDMDPELIRNQRPYKRRILKTLSHGKRGTLLILCKSSSWTDQSEESYP